MKKDKDKGKQLIRLSERRFYQKITDIYTTSVDYNKDAPTTKAFFARSKTNCISQSMAIPQPN